MGDEDQYDFSSASIEESLRRIEEERRAQEEEDRARRAEIDRAGNGRTSGGQGFSDGLNNGRNMAEMFGGGGSALSGAGIGGAGAVTGGSALTGAGGGAAAASYGGGTASTVLPGIFGGATAGSGATAGASGIFGGGVAGGSAAGAGAGGAAAGGGGYSALAAGGPWAALAAAIVGHNQWAKGQGLRDNEKFPLQTGLEGRALYKDSKRYQEWGNRAFDGLGDGARLAGLGSSPTELFKGKNWAEAAKIAAKGGLLGGVLRKIF
jgi:hypothetical protein